MNLLGIDYGEKHIGLSFSQGMLASPLPEVTAVSKKERLKALVDVIERLGIEKIILGLSGGKLDNQVRNFAELVTAQTNIPVDYADGLLCAHNCNFCIRP